MTEDRSAAVATAFVEHVQAFHAGLAGEERHLLEQTFALAQAALTALNTGTSEVQGYFFDASQQTPGGQAPPFVSPAMSLALGTLSQVTVRGWDPKQK